MIEVKVNGVPHTYGDRYSAVEGIIKDAFYDTRDRGGTMHDAAEVATKRLTGAGLLKEDE